MLAEKIEAAGSELAKTSVVGGSIIRAAAGLVFQLAWEPLSAELRLSVNASLVGTLAPFGAAPREAMMDQAGFEALPVVQSLWGFCNRAKDFYRAPGTVPDAVQLLDRAQHFKAVFARMQEGRELFVYTPPNKAA